MQGPKMIHARRPRICSENIHQTLIRDNYWEIKQERLYTFQQEMQ